MPEEGFREDRAKPPQHPESWVKGVYACGQRRDHQVRVHRAHWPPPQQPGLNDRPYITGICERCSATLLLYDPPSADVTIVLYGNPEEASGRVVDEVGAVVTEEMPTAGQVVEEPDPEVPRRGRR